MFPIAVEIDSFGPGAKILTVLLKDIIGDDLIRMTNELHKESLTMKT